MNRYLLAVLYVMAGCAVTVPLKAQSNGEPLRGERCRLIITNTVKVIPVCAEEEEARQVFVNGLPPNFFHFSISSIYASDFCFDKAIRIPGGSLCRTSHKIRAPERMC